MSHRKRRWAGAALTAVLCGNVVRADEFEIVPPPPPDVTTLPAVVILWEEPRPVVPTGAADPPTVLPPADEVKPLTPVVEPPPAVMPPTTLVPPVSLAPLPAVAPPVSIAPPATYGPAPNLGRWSGGAEMLFLTPYVSNNTAFTVIAPPAPPAPGAFPVAIGSAQGQPFAWDCGQAFRAWAGWTHPTGWGIRADGFVYNQESNVASLVNQPDPIAPRLVTVPPVIPFIPGAASFGAPTAVLAGAGIGSDRLLFTSDLNVRTVDAEVTYQWGGCDCLVRVSGGVRWTGLRQGYHAALRNSGDGITTETQQLDFEQEFSGAGPTVGLFLRHTLGADGLAAYGSVRGAILAGHLDQRGAYSQDISDPALLALVGSQQTRTRFDNRSAQVLTEAELEMGLEYAVPVGRSRLFVRGGLVAQSYSNAGSATSSLGTLSLLGGTAAVGVNY
jgi:hypothetical protein